MSSPGEITVVGVPIDGPLGPPALDALGRAALVVGGARLLEQTREAHTAPTWDLTGRMRELRPLLAEHPGPVVVLASGDPMFYGIGGFLARHFPGLRVITSPSSVAVACARVGLGSDDMTLLSAHGRPMPDVAAALDATGKVAVLTDERNTPAAVGRLLGDREGEAWVAERLGEPGEAIHRLPISALRDFAADPLNVLLLAGPRRPRAAIPHTPDERFDKKMPKRGLITKREVRTLSLAALGLRPGDTCWDIGAGSGSVAVEMARLGAGAVYAVEKNTDGVDIINSNAVLHDVLRLNVIHARAPEGLDALPDPDRIFVGGTGGDMAGLVDLCLSRLRPGGRLVLNVATVENLGECVVALKARRAEWSATLVQVSRSSPILDLTRFEAHNPVWIIEAAPASSESA